VGSHIAAFRTPASSHPLRVLQRPNGATPIVFLVVRRLPDWVEVRLPIRPNGSVAWVHAAAVRLAEDPYRITVSLRAHRITLWNAGRVVFRAPAAVGRPAFPTPTGIFYIVALLRLPDPNGPYGPYAFGLSAYSRVLFSYGGGPGQIGIHGTDRPSAIGTSASHGCIRVSNRVIARLAGLLPLGTPVVISAGG
jgi:lipoprotein-anchoring transpeptidase ErfK/SrfK